MKLYEREEVGIVQIGTFTHHEYKIKRTREIMMADYAIVKTIDDFKKLVAAWTWHRNEWHLDNDTYKNLNEGKKVFCYRGRICTTSCKNDFRTPTGTFIL